MLNGRNSYALKSFFTTFMRHSKNFVLYLYGQICCHAIGKNFHCKWIQTFHKEATSSCEQTKHRNCVQCAYNFLNWKIDGPLFKVVRNNFRKQRKSSMQNASDLMGKWCLACPLDQILLLILYRNSNISHTHTHQ